MIWFILLFWVIGSIIAYIFLHKSSNTFNNYKLAEYIKNLEMEQVTVNQVRRRACFLDCSWLTYVCGLHLNQRQDNENMKNET